MTPIQVYLELFLNFLIRSIHITFFKVHYGKSYCEQRIFRYHLKCFFLVVIFYSFIYNEIIVEWFFEKDDIRKWKTLRHLFLFCYTLGRLNLLSQLNTELENILTKVGQIMEEVGEPNTPFWPLPSCATWSFESMSVIPLPLTHVMPLVSFYTPWKCFQGL